MLKHFLSFINNEHLFLPRSRVLLAVSGGLDSIVMAELFHRAGFNFGLAHCNFCLRGNESDAEEIFVKSLAEKYAVSFYTKKFNTRAFALDHNVSIQMAARDLRYAWFESLLTEKHFDFIATAHHLDDQAETFFINLVRGTGLSGLHGIQVKKDRLIRPMLFTKRAEIADFAQQNNLEWREDSSNQTTKYLRNKIRHKLLPVMEEIDPGFSNNLGQTIKRLRDVESIYQEKIKEVRSDLFSMDGKQTEILKSWLMEFQPLKTWLFELLKPFNFSNSVTEDLANTLPEGQGKIFFSSTHRLMVDREVLILQPLKLTEKIDPVAIYYIEEGMQQISKPITLNFELTEIRNIDMQKSETKAYLDFERLEFPLILRRWRKGDWFIPFGMTGIKKLSDFFIDLKLSLPDKENTWLLCSGNDIAWVVGKRIDNRFRIQKSTQKVLIISL